MITHYSGRVPLQHPFEVAVVMPTICRPSLLRAVESVFRQIGVSRLQLLIGIDQRRGDPAIIDAVLGLRPADHAITIFDPGYSTAADRGGIHFAKDCGALRPILSYLANSRYVAYLDDDNWYADTHIAELLKVVEKGGWAHSLRWYVDPQSLEPLCIDIWESVGAGRGIYLEGFGGHVDSSCLMIDKLRHAAAIGHWTIPIRGNSNGRAPDRGVFQQLQQRSPGSCTGQASVYYVISDPPSSVRWARIKGWRATRAARAGCLPG